MAQGVPIMSRPMTPRVILRIVPALALLAAFLVPAQAGAVAPGAPEGDRADLRYVVTRGAVAGDRTDSGYAVTSAGPGQVGLVQGQVGLVQGQVLAVREPLPPGPSPSGDRRRTALWGWPLAGVPPVIKPFDPPPKPWLPGHRGIDLGGVAGEAVLVVDDGVVSYSGTIAGVGIISVTHASGLRSTYQPVTDQAARGRRVSRGQRIATLDSVGSHCVLHDCLHLGAVRGRRDYVDPLPLLLGAELTLLPIRP